MAWVRLCSLADVAQCNAASFWVDGEELLFVRGRDGYLITRMPCRFMGQAIRERTLDACLDATGAPRCNSYGTGTENHGSSVGVSAVPMMRFETREESDSIYVDTEAQRISAYQYLTCAPQVRNDGSTRLILNLWRDAYGDDREVIYG